MASTEAEAPKARDVDDLIQRSLIKAIIEAEQTLNETIREVDQYCAIQGLNRHTANQLIHHELEQYIHQLLPMLESTDLGQQYLHDELIGTIQIDPPSPEEAFVAWNGGGRSADITHVFEAPDPEEPKTVRGLASLLNADMMVSQTFRYHIREEWMGEVAFDHMVQLPVPRSILMDGFKTAKRFAHEAGIGLEMNAEKGSRPEAV